MDARHRSARRAWIGLGLVLMLAGALLWMLRGSGSERAQPLSAPEPAVPPSSAPSAEASAREVDVAPEPPRTEAKPRSRSRSVDDRGAAPSLPESLRGRTVDEARAPLAGVRVGFRGSLERDGRPGATLARVAVSAADGSFAIEDFRPELGAEPPTAELAGHVLLRASECERADDGRWAPMEIVLAPSATLEVLVLGEDRAPLAHQRVAALPAYEELVALGLRVDSWSDEALRRAQTTDGAGLARFELPARRRIGVLVQFRGADTCFEHCEGERLSSADRGSALVLARGERRRVLLVTGIALPLEGVVLDPDLRPVAGARVRVLEGEADENRWAEHRVELKTDSEGRFALTLDDLEREDVLTLIAADGEWIAIENDGAHGATMRRIEVARHVERPEPIELVLEPLLTIQGRVVDETGAPVSVVVWALPPGAPYVLQKGELGFLPISASFSGRGGEFEVPALRPGRHDVLVKRNEPRTYHRFPDVEAGARDLVLVLPDDRVVRLRVVIEGARPGDRLQPIVLWHQPRDAEQFGRPAQSAIIQVDGCDEARWPARELPAELVSAHTASVEHAEGRTLVLLDAASDLSERALEPRQVGWYSVGLRGRDAEGRAYARRLSEPQRLDAGETTFVVRLELAATLECHAPIARGEDLWAELRDSRGDVVCNAQGERWTAPTAAGSFRIDELPPGTLDLRVGSPLELESGRWRWREELHLAPGETASLVLR